MDALLFTGTTTFYQNEFEHIICGCYAVYQTIIQNGTLFQNNENTIRDGFMTYLNDDCYKNSISPLGNFHFEPETIESGGRADIKVLPINPYKGTKEYYLIECKRLNKHNTAGYTGLNAEYIKNGICRFVTESYSSYYNCNAMFGFVVDSMNIEENVAFINKMLCVDFINDKGIEVNAQATQRLSNITLVNDFNFAYLSKHKTKSNREITLYHLMFDFSNSII